MKFTQLLPGIAILSGTALVSALVVTNPSEADYANFVSQTLDREAKAYLCEAEGIPPLSERLDGLIGNLCEQFVNRVVSADQLQQLLMENTQRQNRWLWSTYQTRLPTKTYRFIGILGKFYPYRRDESAASPST